MSANPSDLDHATRVEPDDGAGEGRFVAHLSEDWEIWGPNGGYLAAIALRAAGSAAQIQQPASFYCHFLSSPAFAAVQLEVSVLKRGRRAESFAVEMSQEGKPILVDHECSVASHGLMGVSGSVWDTAGRLLATGSAQLCCVPNVPNGG